MLTHQSEHQLVQYRSTHTTHYQSSHSYYDPDCFRLAFCFSIYKPPSQPQYQIYSLFFYYFTKFYLGLKQSLIKFIFKTRLLFLFLLLYLLFCSTSFLFLLLLLSCSCYFLVFLFCFLFLVLFSFLILTKKVTRNGNKKEEN